MIELKKDMKILLQGDSITDNGKADVNEFMGIGYARFLTCYLQGQFPQLHLTTVNRAISGNRVCDLVERWDWDTIRLNPDVCIVMVGVNDCIYKYLFDMNTSIEDYERDYREILEKNKTNNIKTIMMEPYLVFTQPEKEKWYKEDLIYRQEICAKLAKEYNCEYIHLHNVFQEACKIREANFWSQDGVHPAMPGQFLIAREVLKVFGIEL